MPLRLWGKPGLWAETVRGCLPAFRKPGTRTRGRRWWRRRAEVLP